MKKRGPPKTPTSLRILRGNPGKRPLNDSEPQPTTGLPECPDHLSAKARDAWHRFARELESCGVATRLDSLALELLCSSYAMYLDAAEKVAKTGAVWVEKGNSAIPKFVYSPFWCVMNREWKNVSSMLAEFGMTPSSRSSVTVDAPVKSVIPKRQRGA